jgi:hypothetical protein
MNVLHFDSKLSEQARRERLYGGEVFVFSPTPSTVALSEYGRNRVTGAFGGIEPEIAQFEMPVEDYVKIIGPLKTDFYHDPHSHELLLGVVAEFGCDLGETYFDVPKIRMVTHGGYLTSGMGYAHPPHRDTWYGSPISQINWWMPIYDLVSENSLAIHFDYWTRPVNNNSREFNYFDWNRERKTVAQHVKNDTRLQPHPEESVEMENQTRVICPAGGIILFSGAQLHSTVPNTAGVARFSIDFRTVHAGDVAAKRGAINVDSFPPATNLRDFRRGSDLSRLPLDLVEQYEEAGVAEGREEDFVFQPG